MAERVLALTKDGRMTYCTVSPDMRGKGRCNHVMHQNDGETQAEFIDRMNDYVANNTPKNDSFIPSNGTVIETKPYRMTDEEKAELEHIENRMQLDQNIDGGYITVEDYLWNDMDKAYFSQMSNMSLKDIDSVLHSKEFIVVDSNDSEYPVGKIIYGLAENKSDLEIEESESLRDELENRGITIDTGTAALNNVAENMYNWHATSDIYVLPYYMRQGTEDGISSDITNAYKFLLRQHKDVDAQQQAYELLLNNTGENAKYYKGYKTKSLVDEFAGKGGVFRAYLSGNSIPYSGRAVITPNADLKYGEVAVPPSMCVDIYKPTLVNQLRNEGYTDKDIDSWVARYRAPQTEISNGDILELQERINRGDVRVIMNRQPSLHTSSLQSFRPVVSNNATVQIHPLYCSAYGADYDGDCVSIYGINDREISSVADNSIGAHNLINTQIPRAMSHSNITPSKDALFGILNILDKRSN